MNDRPIPGVRVPLIDEAEAAGMTAELYERIKKTTGLPFVPDMFRLVSTRPDLLEVVLAGYIGAFGDGILPRATREMISAWSSKINGCPYCVGTHNWFLTQFGGGEELTRAIAVANEPEELPIDARTLALMRLVTQVSRAAYKVTDEDWARVTEAGWSNEEMLEAVFTSALFAFINRLVDGLGLGGSVAHSRISQQPDVDAGGVG
ncbi:peroxidase-related enzyme [Streptomyces sp. R302]|uniref:carboxymuconolactone decarboxylase family protein n=1 Tax=unclassified Streptomyces TaxID=2593676 RepID=UPI00145FB334|nr:MULTISPECIES: peroxidase-related enzyme [unclassified Streptomyces]NML50994.1 peroxidase-related enzyme [Streptomyces sp. R301]NML81088.1 peroxidase-related enzyme [Streptomyces sp. R302]